MNRFGQYRWFVLAGGITLALAGVSAIAPRGPVLTGSVDVGYLLLTLAVGVAMLANAWSGGGANRRFWALMGSGCILWSLNEAAWVYFEVLRHTAFPDPSFMDVFLFLHPVPMIAAVGLRPHRSGGEQKFHVRTLDFLMLLVWWLFLYAFVVFPPQYASVNVAEYDRNFGPLYLGESGVLVLVLGIAALGASAGWKKVYLNLMAASAVYALGSEAVNQAITRGSYYTGSLYDVPLMGAVIWMAATTLTARQWQPEAVPPKPEDKWGVMALRLAMLAILSLPALGLWAYRWDSSTASVRTFRLFTVLAAMLVLGAFVFVRQYLQDRALIHLLEDSRRSFENEQRLQSHLVQREKLASLGQLVAGAAQEIDHPLTAIMEYSEKLWSNQRLTGEQDRLVRKIVDQSLRTRDLIANLLSFAQQSSGDKMMVDLSMLLQRSVQMRELQRHDQKIRIEVMIDPNLPRVWGDGHQLFQAFVQMVENALDALEEAGGGMLRVSAQPQGEEVVVQFSDSGPGIREPLRVFDPFYTTKPIGKGTGLGLSAVYGMVQEHRGQITCQNKPEGGALFVLRLPVASANASRAAGAAHS
ncbi:MAG TPA: HAMP domain-containing sensor histidine kinase [Candidatus Sulfotelmatobacter sp.]|jgi:signal transduction histidine kinase|nr:HAMP domain-containing sensor histidine kinase [Candidatus Sulfotelmatobacter sp.]